MDLEIWKAIVSVAAAADRDVLRECGRLKEARFTNRLIALMYCWSVWHDRPLSWACDRRHYGPLFRPRKLPSVSQFCKRVKDDPRVCRTLGVMQTRLCAGQTPSVLSCFDGKLLPVAMHSRDPDATKVRANAGVHAGLSTARACGPTAAGSWCGA